MRSYRYFSCYKNRNYEANPQSTILAPLSSSITPLITRAICAKYDNIHNMTHRQITILSVKNGLETPQKWHSLHFLCTAPTVNKSTVERAILFLPDNFLMYIKLSYISYYYNSWAPLLLLLGHRKETVFSKFLQISGHFAQRTNSCRILWIVVTLYFNI